MSSGFESVATLSELLDGEVTQIEYKDAVVGLYRVGDEVFALCDVCTHEEAYLSEGEFEADDYEVECPLHGSRFDVRDGSVRILPATKAAKVHPVRIEGDEVLIGPAETGRE